MRRHAQGTAAATVPAGSLGCIIKSIINKDVLCEIKRMPPNCS